MKLLLISLLIVTSLVLFCNYFLDAQIALAVYQTMDNHERLENYTSNIPDLLFYIVCIVTLVSWLAYFLLKNKAEKHALFFQVVALCVPAAYGTKIILKLVFGRVNTKTWLHHPYLYGFHWLHGGRIFDGFPSGHMTIFTTLLLALSHFYPRYWKFSVGALVLLAVALVTTDYHFLSDVIAGAYLGVIVYIFTCISVTKFNEMKKRSFLRTQQPRKF